MKTAKEVFDNKYEYYRNMDNNPAIPLEARELIFTAMKDYADESVKFHCENLLLDFDNLLKDFYLWIDSNYALGMLTDKADDVIKEYLKYKGMGKTLQSTHN